MKKNRIKISCILLLILFFTTLGIISVIKSDATQNSQSKKVLGSAQLSSRSTVANLNSDSSINTEENQKETAKKRIAPGSDLSADELAVLSKMTLMLFQFTQPESRLQDLLRYLDGTGQKPIVVNNSNADTGEMAIVRTAAPLLGTRYFHAQYFSDDSQKGFVQHMSFELKSGAESMASAVAAVQNNFPNLPDPRRRTADFIQWDLPGGQILWIKKMAANDLKDNPFNAYTNEDVGTVQVAVELEIHDDQP